MSDRPKRRGERRTTERRKGPIRSVDRRQKAAPVEEERRSGGDRRGPDRRSGRERRSGKDRRRW
jgi:hypothetical protein